MRIATTLIDVEAMWHVLLYSLLATVALVTAYGAGVLALDRIDRPEAGGGARAGWTLAIGAAGLVCLALVVVGVWAMTQK
jgi:hypothetical protein